MDNDIYKMLLKDKVNYDKLRNYFEYEFDDVIDYFFDTINRLVRCNSKKNMLKVNELLSFLRMMVDDFDSSKLDVIVINCLDLKDNLNSINVFNKGISLKVDEVLNDIYYENSDKYKFDMTEFLNYLIYEDKNIKRLKIFLYELDKSYLVSEQYDNIFVELLNKFNVKDKGLKKYYYKVSILLIDKMSNSLLAKNRYKYLRILDELKVHSLYSDDLYNFFSDNYVSDDVLLSRFDVSYSFLYKYDSYNIIVNDDDIPNLKQGAITIDKNNTLKMDDAIFWKKNKDNTYTLYVHVSFVPALVEYDSVINREARKRYKSLYAFDKVVSILPNDLVLNKFSLIKNNYRNVVTFSIKLDRYMNVIPDTFKISRTNVRVTNNFDYASSDFLIENNCSDDVGDMLRNLAVFSFNCSGEIDVERALGDNEYFNNLVGNKNVSRDIVYNVMRNINHYAAKYFMDRGYPYLYKYSCFKDSNYSDFNSVVRNNCSLVRNKELINNMEDTFFDIMFSSVARDFFEFDCYSSSTDPLWKYSSLYNQYLINNFVFCKNNSSNFIEEWYNITRALANELNLKKQENKDIETVCKCLSRIRNKY